ncbi:DUF1217 domain-containing protein [Aureimonas sp. AU12]|uniref:DUF1217 domain-containing protein n=1 Tax=Aureimonas sp. AU12 TaxID=1638161 RepID=UPI0007823A3B|nr:DUF1217 domain-containing protein [Aureimonas sp. AU12]
MISTLLNYRLYTNNMAQTLERLSDQATVAKSAQYYDDKIGGVSSVDEFLGDFRLYSYAMKAYGLEDQIGSKGLMRKVLESDLSDTASFANKLVDKRYAQFASAFNFSASAAKPTAQSTAQTDRIVEAYGERVDRSAPIAAAATSHFEDAMPTVTTVAAFVGDRRLVDVALRAAGVADPSRVTSSYVSGLLDGTIAPTPGTAFVTLKGFFTTGANASLSQNAAQISNLVYQYNEKTGNATSPQAAQANIDYLKAVLAKSPPVANVTELTGDDRILKMMHASVGLSETYTATFIADILKSQANVDAMPTVSASGEVLPARVAAKAKMQALRDMFRFDANGAVRPSTETDANGVSQPYNVPLPPKATETFFNGYLANYKAAATKADGNASAVFVAGIAKVTSVTDLIRADASVVGSTRRTNLEYVLKAFDIDPATASLSTIRAVLTSDPSDPDSYVSKLKDERYSKLAAAFNFGEDGKLRAERSVQSVTDRTKTATLYSATFGTDQSDAKKAVVKADTQRYLEATGAIYSIDGLLADEKTVRYALTAYGVKDTDISKADLRKILTSDLSDPKSFANAQTDKAVAKFAAAFNFETDGSLENTGSGAQSGAARRTTDNLYLLQTLEEQSGETSEGTRLALYFLRNAPNVTTAYGLLADKALFQVARTALGLPDGMSSMDVAKQAKLLESRIDFTDFADPAKLDKFIARFAGMYDVASTDASSSPILALFNGGSGSGSGLLSLF